MTKKALMILSVIAAAPASTPISPGRWVINNQIEDALFNGQSHGASLPRSKPISVCLMAADASKGPGLAFTDMDQCKVLNSTLKDGTFAYEAECKATESTDKILTESTGHYTNDSYDGSSTSIQRRDGMQIKMRSHVKAQRVGDC